MVTSWWPLGSPEHLFSASTDPPVQDALPWPTTCAALLEPPHRSLMLWTISPSPTAALEPGCKLTVRSSLV